MPKNGLILYSKDGVSVAVIPQKLQIVYKNTKTGVTKIYGIIVSGNGISFRKEETKKL